MNWSPQQDAAIAAVRKWYADRFAPPIFRLFGFAGTGKTTLAKELAMHVRGTVLYATFTGKAALVLRKKGCDEASTIHSLIYTAAVDDKTGDVSFVLNEASALYDASLLIVDEVSMVGTELAKDLLSFGVRILVLGDPAQLPPVRDEGYFINAPPDVMLTEVHRQAAENPIIRMSMDIREGRRLEPGQFGDSLIVRQSRLDRDELGEKVVAADQLICGLNRSRVGFNRRIRAMKGLVGVDLPWHPAVGDRLICLRNNKKKHLFNGGLWQVRSAASLRSRMHILASSLDERRDPVNLKVPEQFFNGTDGDLPWRERQKNEEFTFGWAITCHKSQGSQWDNPIIFDESASFREARANWLYTAVTRAAERVTVVV